ncbi:hypothetical protein BD779DRAFT_206426 [Infundibulicybe gibba]|nr:hypothetical protein BD779DRAFT_206426 [Infundibulicybe gibba]
MIKGCLTYTTWEEHIQSLPAGAPIPDTIPLSWNLETQSWASMGYFATGPRMHDFPIHVETWCDKCRQRPITKQVCFSCTICPNMDLCALCYLLPPTETNIAGHSDAHEMVKRTLFSTAIYRAWIVGLARFFLTEFYSQRHLKPVPAPEKGGPVKVARIPRCRICGEQKHGSIFQCMEIACFATGREYFLCDDCEKATSGNPCSPPKPEAMSITGNGDSTPQHQPWHTMLIIHPDINSGGPWSSHLFEECPPPMPTTSNTTLTERATAVEGRLEVIESKIASIEVALRRMETLWISRKTGRIGTSSARRGRRNGKRRRDED